MEEELLVKIELDLLRKPIDLFSEIEDYVESTMINQKFNLKIYTALLEIYKVFI